MPGRRIDREQAEKRLLDALKGGNTVKDSAYYAGISEDTFARWCKNADFADRIKKAETEAVVRNVAQIQKAAQDGCWQANAWWLERKRPADWKKRDSVEVSSDPEKPAVIMVLRGVSMDEL